MSTRNADSCKAYRRRQIAAGRQPIVIFVRRELLVWVDHRKIETGKNRSDIINQVLEDAADT